MKHSNPKVLIVEDERIIAEKIKLLLIQQGYLVVDIVDNADDAISILEKIALDLVLVDIKIIGDLDGIDLAHYINQHFQTPFIFITSNTDPKHLNRLKITNPAGLLVKPYKPKELQITVEIALHQSRKPQTTKTTQTEDTSWFVKDKELLVKLNVVDILYVKAMDNYVNLVTATKKYTIHQTLQKVEEKLLPFGFMRVHRSYLLNLRHIQKIENKQIVVGKDQVPLSRSYYQELINRLQQF
ncbi:MAG: response regulator transcription factor [Aureispira sp.]|nr:response regulator transcription factor [Aureispira sp.]